jgi:putative PIN family toxin of toxin-antitoxin system
MIRAVADTNVFISAALNPRGTPAMVLGTARNSFQLVWSAGIVAECLRVLTYERVAKRLRSVGGEDAAHALLTRLGTGAEIVAPDLIPAIRIVDGDPSDDLLIATALAGRASVLVTGDRKHLLAMQEFAGVRILDPAAFARELGLPGFPAPSGGVHEPVAPYGDGMAALAREAQRWVRRRARASKAGRPLPL